MEMGILVDCIRKKSPPAGVRKRLWRGRRRRRASGAVTLNGVTIVCIYIYVIYICKHNLHRLHSGFRWKSKSEEHAGSHRV